MILSPFEIQLLIRLLLAALLGGMIGLERVFDCCGCYGNSADQSAGTEAS
jgi:hypothetical protein